MPKTSDHTLPRMPVSGGAADDPRHFCRLFADMITEGLCRLRKKELNMDGVLSCSGCGKDLHREALQP